MLDGLVGPNRLFATVKVFFFFEKGELLFGYSGVFLSEFPYVFTETSEF